VLWSVVPTLVSISTFAVYTLLGNTLTAADAFTSLALFNLLRFPLAMLPSAIAQVHRSYVYLRWLLKRKCVLLRCRLLYWGKPICRGYRLLFCPFITSNCECASYFGSGIS